MRVSQVLCLFRRYGSHQSSWLQLSVGSGSVLFFFALNSVDHCGLAAIVAIVWCQTGPARTRNCTCRRVRTSCVVSSAPLYNEIQAAFSSRCRTRREYFGPFSPCVGGRLCLCLLLYFQLATFSSLSLLFPLHGVVAGSLAITSFDLGFLAENDYRGFGTWYTLQASPHFILI